MATAQNKTQCFICNKVKITYPCQGCSNQFCFEDLNDHRQKLNEEFNVIINDYDQFRENITKNESSSSLMNRIDQWEITSIELIQQTAEECRKNLIERTETIVSNVEVKFNKLREEIKEIREENDFNEINLIYLRKQLNEITEDLNNSLELFEEEEKSQTFIKKISIQLKKSMLTKLFFDLFLILFFR